MKRAAAFAPGVIDGPYQRRAPAWRAALAVPRFAWRAARAVCIGLAAFFMLSLGAAFLIGWLR